MKDKIIIIHLHTNRKLLQPFLVSLYLNNNFWILILINFSESESIILHVNIFYIEKLSLSKRTCPPQLENWIFIEQKLNILLDETGYLDRFFFNPESLYIGFSL